MKWEKVKLGDYINVLSGFPFASNGFNDTDGTPVIRIRDVVRGYTETFYRGEYDESFLIQKGDILVGMDGEFNAARWGSEPALLNQRVCRISTKYKSLLSEKYLIYLLPKKLKEIEDKTAFVTVKHLSVKGINNIEFLLPPLHIQEQIADTLDKADALRRKDQELLQKYDELAQAIFYDMFGDPVRNEKGWIKCLLKDLVEVKGGKRLPLDSDFSSTETDYPYIRVKDFENQSVNLTNLKYITAETHKIIKRYIINSGDVYISIAGTIGLCGTLPEVLDGANLTENAAKLVIRDKNLLTPDYLSAFLMSPYGQGEITKRTMAVGVPKLAIFRIEELDILLPPLEVQNSYVDKLQKISEVKVQTEKCQQKTESMFRSFLATSFS